MIVVLTIKEISYLAFDVFDDLMGLLLQWHCCCDVSICGISSLFAVFCIPLLGYRLF